ncbi:MAG: DNA translocase FtsK 4TM domain-containing protein, partial [Colwellia sp.]|nr:DNA translocase FtsK 4TM domain-containing protein [Colwellia sp.]
MPSELVKNPEQNLGEVNNLNTRTSQLTGVQRLLETGLLFFSLFAMFMMLALFSFDPADPGWAQTGYQTPVRNLGGAVGAYLSDLLLNLFGFIAYSLPFIIAIIGWLLFQKFHQLMQLDYLTLALKLVGFFMLYLGITSLASMNFDDLFYFSAGGILGDVLSETLLPYFSFVGSTLVFVMFSCAGFVLLTGFSWLNFIDDVGRYAIASALFLVHLPSYIKDKFGVGEPTLTDNNKLESEGLDEEAHVDNKLEETPLTKSKKKKLRIPFLASMPAKKDEAQDHFIDINELMGGPLEIKVQEHVSDAEISAAFADVEKVVVADDNVFENEKPTGELINSSDASQVNLVPTTDEKFLGMPSIDLLDRPDKAKNPINREELEQVSRLVETILLDFKVQAKVVAVYPGPVITRFELDLAPGMKVSKISALSKDLARALSAISVRVVEVIPGKSVIGLELPNKHREIVHLSEVISCTAFEESNSPLAMVLGKDIAGEPVVVDLAKMPHLLVAGTTGSGKSVGVNTMIVSLLYKSTPEDVRLIMIDPKMLELSVYEGIPHLLTEVVTDMKDAANALRWCVGEM